MRYDLAFFLCCCNAFLSSSDDDEESNYYALLNIDRDASQEEIKRAYKRQSLQMHPDKLAQRGQAVTPELQHKFTLMKEAYETLSDPHKRETYDAIGATGMKWMEEPFSIDPAQLAHNFAKSSVLDRAKIFGIFVAAAVAVLIQPILICLHVDGDFGDDASWLATLTPLWLWNAFLLFYHSRVILMGPIPRPDHIPEADWVDPLPMQKRIFSMARFILIVLFEILVALKLDAVWWFATTPWSGVFVPLYVWEATTLYKKWPLARMRIVTVEDLEAALGKPFSEFTATEKELIGQRYSVVSSTTSPDFGIAQKLKTRARHDIIKSLFRIAFCVVLLVQLDGGYDWNWWLVFLPFWIMICLICYANYQSFAEVQTMAMEKDPTLFAAAMPMQQQQQQQQQSNQPNSSGKTDYGAVGENGAATPTDTQQQQSTLSPEEREELKAQVMASSSKLCSKCCSQGFLLVILFLFVGKLQGAGFSSFLIISPFLAVAGILLCCIGCAIFGVTEVPTDGINFDSDDFAYVNAEGGQAAPATASSPNNTPNVYVPPPPPPSQQQQHQRPPEAPAPTAPATPAPAVVVPTPQPTVVPPTASDQPTAAHVLSDGNETPATTAAENEQMKSPGVDHLGGNDAAGQQRQDHGNEREASTTVGTKTESGEINELD